MQLNQPSHQLNFPREILSLVASYVQPAIFAVDPECYRAARKIQSLHRGLAVRRGSFVCQVCGEPDASPHWTLAWSCDDCKYATFRQNHYANPAYDAQGYDIYGYDADGLDNEGYDFGGYNVHGFNRHGDSWRDQVDASISTWHDSYLDMSPPASP